MQRKISPFSDYAIRGGLEGFVNKLKSGLEITIAFIGGSVTVGAGASGEDHTSYRSLICEYLKRKFPQIAFNFINAGIGGTDSTFGAYRLKSQIFQELEIDLLFVEFAVNDSGNRTESIRAMEGIVRHSRRLHPMIDIIYLYTPIKTAIELFKVNGITQENIYNHEEVAVYYQLPSVNIAKQIYRLIEADELVWHDLSSDDVHPNDVGHVLYAHYVEAFLEKALSTRSSVIPHRPALPSPMDIHCYEYADLVSPRAVIHAEGWEIVEGWMVEATCNWTPPADVYVGNEAGASFHFEFHGTAFGLSMLAGMDTGSIDFSLDGGEYQSIQLFDEYCLAFYRPKIVLLADSLSRNHHTVDIRISREKDEASTGYAVRILNLLINQ
ncbi:hypothetical protein GC096_18765 [Paenibacillus sp. LMG 31461]|uniref:SGNH hydrolase-type esterase domain-containing protein n=1 Tax=Paenibacillus plantarum TaxID=2654975 RepID=A0ABX1XC96_9BACL|nr:SGNH/GDSL hydrolase family protein [Paenibacillus plantarum]NOU66082.1 hypothetical protein [Paenibacillus plantarum]